MKKWFKYFVYISLIFLIIALIRTNYLQIPEIKSYWLLAASLVVLFFSFGINGLNWWLLLKTTNKNIKIRDGIVSNGLSTLGKYIPGKVWRIAGQAAFINQKYGGKQSIFITLSFNELFLSLWAGILVSFIGLYSVGQLQIYGYVLLLSWFGLSLILFTPYPHKLFCILLKKIKLSLEIPFIHFTKLYKIIPLFLGYWLLLSASFYLLTLAIFEIHFSLNVGNLFVFSCIVGFLALIFPGGIGVRESILFGLLVSKISEMLYC